MRRLLGGDQQDGRGRGRRIAASRSASFSFWWASSRSPRSPAGGSRGREGAFIGDLQRLVPFQDLVGRGAVGGVRAESLAGRGDARAGVRSASAIDTDGDGTPDGRDRDLDGDHRSNGRDGDVDGDRTPNGRDPDVDGDGAPNGRDRDVDGDGAPNTRDSDIDGDGVPNARDREMDGDGLPNGRDPDIDGDGVPNGRDATPRGPVATPSVTAPRASLATAGGPPALAVRRVAASAFTTAPSARRARRSSRPARVREVAGFLPRPPPGVKPASGASPAPLPAPCFLAVPGANGTRAYERPDPANTTPRRWAGNTIPGAAQAGRRARRSGGVRPEPARRVEPGRRRKRGYEQPEWRAGRLRSRGTGPGRGPGPVRPFTGGRFRAGLRRRRPLSGRWQPGRAGRWPGRGPLRPVSGGLGPRRGWAA